MHLQIISPFKLNWINYLREVFRDWRVSVADKPHPEVKPDVMLFMWSDDQTIDFINNHEKVAKYVVFLRSYEYMEYPWQIMDFGKIDRFLVVNDFIGKMVKDQTGILTEVIYNGVPLDKWTYRERKHGNKIAMVGAIHYKKNHPLALQILSRLPEDYELHCAGTVQCPDVVYYMDKLAKSINRKVAVYGQVPENEMNDWLEDKNYILSCSVREGSPNNVIEAMAKGIMPMVHNWPGAHQQFGNYVFDTVDQAVLPLNPIVAYRSEDYRGLIERKFSMKNYYRIKEIANALI